jgi:divalent metal cation (Fe/Co/Zn/Cd) transporter
MSEQGNTKRRHEQTSRKVVYAAVVAHLSTAAAKWVAAALTRSSAMLAEAIYPTVDTGNELLLL